MRAPPSSRAMSTHGPSGIRTTPPRCCRAASGYSLTEQIWKQTGSFYLASRPYAERNGAFIEGVLDTFTQADALTHSQRAQSITLLAKTMGLPEAVIDSYLDHRPPTAVTPVSAETAARQQQTADLFYENKLVPKKVDIRARIWQPTATQGAKS